VAERYEAVEQDFVHQVRESGWSADELAQQWDEFAARRASLKP
jgi:hypothetical protein